MANQPSVTNRDENDTPLASSSANYSHAKQISNATNERNLKAQQIRSSISTSKTVKSYGADQDMTETDLEKSQSPAKGGRSTKSQRVKPDKEPKGG